MTQWFVVTDVRGFVVKNNDGDMQDEIHTTIDQAMLHAGRLNACAPGGFVNGPTGKMKPSPTPRVGRHAVAAGL